MQWTRNVNTMQCDILCYVPYCEYHRYDYKDEQRDDNDVLVCVHPHPVYQAHGNVVYHAQCSIVTVCII